jgi:hypothetical protein
MKNFNINNTNGEKLLKNEELLNLRGGTHECLYICQIQDSSGSNLGEGIACGDSLLGVEFDCNFYNENMGFHCHCTYIQE